MFDVFDKPDPNATCARRHVSTTAPQSLTLLNSTFSYSTARERAVRLMERAANPRERLEALYWTVFSRSPSAAEAEWGEAFLRDAVAPKEAWHDLCLALLNANEAIYVD